MGYMPDFIDWLNNDVGGEGPLPEIKHGTYGDAMAYSMQRHYAEDRERGGLRMSNIGKPAVVLALAHLGYVEPEPKGKSRLIFHTGDMFENWLEVMLQVYGFEIIDSQPTVQYMGITGHADFVVEHPETRKKFIIEAKTMSEGYSRMFSRELNDDRGYISQLAMYSRGLGYDATWLCWNKGNSECFELTPAEGLLDQALDRAQQVIKRVQKVKTLDDVLASNGGQFQAPPPRPEVYKGKPTGKFLPHSSVSYSPFKSALYVLSDGVNQYKKPTTYVERVADTEHMRNELEFLVENGTVIKH